MKRIKRLLIIPFMMVSLITFSSCSFINDFINSLQQEGEKTQEETPKEDIELVLQRHVGMFLGGTHMKFLAIAIHCLENADDVAILYARLGMPLVVAA